MGPTDEQSKFCTRVAVDRNVTTLSFPTEGNRPAPTAFTRLETDWYVMAKPLKVSHVALGTLGHASERMMRVKDTGRGQWVERKQFQLLKQFKPCWSAL